MNANLVGGHWVLNMLPVWATALVLYAVTLGVIFILRDKYEGLFYNTSYSAMLGDGALLVVVLMAAGVLQREILLPSWLQSKWFHFGVAILGIGLGIRWWGFDAFGVMLENYIEWGDIYHHLVIVPLLCYLGVTLLPVIWLAGTRVDKWSTLFLVLLWVMLVVYDTRTKRFNQRHYLKKHEIYLNWGKPSWSR